MSTADADGDQAVRFTVDEARAIRGAFNVVCELLSAPGLEVPPGVPISRDRLPLFDRLSALFDTRIEAARGREAGFQEALQPAEAQAIRDVVGALQTLLGDRGGRELLAEIGFLVRPGQPVDEAELERLQDIVNKIDPTGVREITDTEPGAAPPTGSALERIQTLQGETDVVLRNPIETEDELDRALRALNLMTADCNSLLADYGDLAQMAAQVAAGGEPDRPDFGERATLLDRVDAAAEDLAERIREVGCLDPTTVFELEDAFSAITTGAREPELSENLDRFLAELREAVEGREGEDEGLPGAFDDEPPLVFGPEPTDEFFPDKPTEPRSREEQLQRIDRLRAEIEDVLENPAKVDINASQMEDLVEDALPAQGNINCNTLLVALAEIAQLSARAVAGAPPGPQGMPMFGPTVRQVNDARRLVIARMERSECLPRGVLMRLRNSVLSIVEPLEDDPENLERRAFNALSDIRDAFEGPRGDADIVGP